MGLWVLKIIFISGLIQSQSFFFFTQDQCIEALQNIVTRSDIADAGCKFEEVEDNG